MILSLVFAASARAATHHGDFGYTVTVPDVWKQIPNDVVQKYSDVIQTDKAKKTIVYDAAFQPKRNEEWFEYPYAMVQIIPYRNFGLDRQVNEDEIEQLTKKVTGMDLKKVTDNQLKPEAKSLLTNASLGEAKLDMPDHRYTLPIQMDVQGIGKVQGKMVGYFGKTCLVQVGYYAKATDWDKEVATGSAFIDSLKFDAETAYSAEEAHAGGSFWGNVSSKAIAGAVVGGIGGWCVWIFTKFKKKQAVG